LVVAAVVALVVAAGALVVAAVVALVVAAGAVVVAAGAAVVAAVVALVVAVTAFVVTAGTVVVAAVVLGGGPPGFPHSPNRARWRGHARGPLPVRRLGEGPPLADPSRRSRVALVGLSEGWGILHHRGGRASGPAYSRTDLWASPPPVPQPGVIPPSTRPRLRDTRRIERAPGARDVSAACT